MISRNIQSKTVMSDGTNERYPSPVVLSIGLRKNALYFFFFSFLMNNKAPFCGAPVPHACNPSYSGGKNQEDLGLQPAWAISSARPI
jgi:hypothetical protein